jgi:hypothetical protein
MFVVCDDDEPVEVACETKEGGNYVLHVIKIFVK